MVQSYLPGGANVHPHLTRGSLAHPSPHPKWHIYRFIHLCRADSTASLYFTAGHTFPLNVVAPSVGGYGPPSNTWFLGHTRVHNPNSNSIGSAVFARLMIMTDRPHYSTCNSRPHLHMYTVIHKKRGSTFVVITLEKFV